MSDRPVLHVESIGIEVFIIATCERGKALLGGRESTGCKFSEFGFTALRLINAGAALERMPRLTSSMSIEALVVELAALLEA